MPWNEDHKSHTRYRILESAAVLFSQQGFNGASIDQVMEHAGLTRGAFYTHFASKSELYAEALSWAAQENVARLKGACPSDRVFDYLSDAHRNSETINCPLACLVSDVAQQDQSVRDTYTRLFAGFVSHCQSTDSNSDDRKQAMQQAVLLIGGIAISRNLTDEPLAQELLDVCRTLALDLIPT
ncbi:TetR/AcrR family transcriptional regulator [Granulosicoccus antarcticus]|uniref:HTH-type transcriptional regulator AcrR n=1 Tax=Granulosicoccus antarcticus IMCC3135 TaxID=1192854 RepID=A0A2Z2NND3_9GAMM|nr:TetR/AcrR family transcriptional regulator [Granulosicoccus antarcticus]ASJ72916.1 HTH-type transcriptional regulator AcrR [Granulosicoccus antarcticus IMCC3135]